MGFLTDGQWLVLQTPLTAGMVVTLNSDKQDLSPCSKGASTANPKGGPIQTNIQLLNDEDDVVLEISIRREQNSVLFNAQAKQSALDGWGQPESIPLSVINPSPSTSGLTILVCDRKDKYQILFNLTTVHYFAKRLPGPATSVQYVNRSPGNPTLALSVTLKVDVRKIDSLPAHEKGPINSGRYAHVPQI